MNRLSNEMTSEISRLNHKVDQLSADNEKLCFSVISSGGDVGDLGESVADVTSMTQNKGNNQTASDHVAMGPSTTVDPHVAQIQIAMIKTILADESLSEENREVAKGVLDARVSSSLELSKRQRSAAPRQRGECHHGRVERTSRQRKEAGRRPWVCSCAGCTGRTKSVVGRVGLMDHEQAFVDVGGPDVALDDLQFCRQEDVDAIAKGMSYLEAQRLNQAMERLKSEKTQAGDDG